jgi:glycosyltransferase involved in cell wall biosynthesis
MPWDAAWAVGAMTDPRADPMRSPVISVVIPVFNAQSHLVDCLDAALTQDFAEFEIVAVDDGSRDGSTMLLSRYHARDARVRVVTQGNRGPSVTRNVGLSHAVGDYVWFVDADDAVMPGAFARLAAAARDHAADIVTFNAQNFGDGIVATPIYARPKPAGVVTGEAWIRHVSAQQEFQHFPWVNFYRRAFLARHTMAFVENILHEDIGWNTECLLRAERVVYIDAMLYRYRRHAASLTGGRDDARVLRRIDGYFTVVEELRSINERCTMTAATRHCLQSEIVGQGLQIDRLCASLAEPALRGKVRARCRALRFWETLLNDATDWRRKRQVLKVLLRQRLRVR